MGLVESIANAIAQMESGGNPNAISYRQNNPGNLRAWGSNPVVNGYASFPTMEAGWQALYSQIQTNINRGLTLNEFFGGKPGVYGGYAPSGDSNTPGSYAAYVAGAAGISPDVPLNGVSPGNPTRPRRPRRRPGVST